MSAMLACVNRMSAMRAGLHPVRGGAAVRSESPAHQAAQPEGHRAQAQARVRGEQLSTASHVCG